MAYDRPAAVVYGSSDQMKKLAPSMQEGRPEGVFAMRRLVIILLVVIGLMTLGLRANGGIELRGQLSANDTEMQEGYFAVAQDTVLMVRPGSALHQWLKEHSGQMVRVIVEPASTK